MGGVTTEYVLDDSVGLIAGVAGGLSDVIVDTTDGANTLGSSCPNLPISQFPNLPIYQLKLNPSPMDTTPK
jgi:hypothetical protein